MSDAEKAVLKKLLHEVADEALPGIVAAELAKIPAPYDAVSKIIADALMPKLVEALDAKIDAI